MVTAEIAVQAQRRALMKQRPPNSSEASNCQSIKAVADLLPDKRNANRGKKRGAAAIEASLRRFGAGRSILLDRNLRIIAGNKTAEQATRAGLRDVLIVPSDGKRLVAVQRMDLDLDTDAGARALAIADNRAAELSLDWNDDVIAELSGEVDLEPFFTEAELAGLIGPPEVSADEQVAASDAELEVLRGKWRAAPGQIWQCGQHRIACGDSTDGTVVSAVLAGAQPQVMVTDPPYGVEYDPSMRSAIDGSPRHAGGAVAHDDTADWSSALRHFGGAVMYVWHAAVHAGRTAASIEALGFQIRAQIVWAKSQLVVSRGHYHWQHEPCWYAVRKGCRSGWRGDRKQSTLWQIDTVTGDERSRHGTQKPVELFVRPIMNHTVKGDAVYDPFLGSGTAIVAAEQIGRVCYGIELDPRYVAVALERCAKAGLDPKLAV